MQHIIFYALVHACCPSYTDEKKKGIAVAIAKECLVHQYDGRVTYAEL